MKLVIGGFAQGKLEYVQRTYAVKEHQILDAEIPKEKTAEWVVIDHFQDWVKKQLKNEKDPKEQVLNCLEYQDQIIIICDEIGNGIVPMDAFERAYREETGRILIELAKRADEVVRVICGIGQKIK